MDGYKDNLAEHLEVFGGDSVTHKLIKTKLTEVFELLDNDVCQHKEKEVFPDGSGYCVECGFSFKNVSGITSGECLHENKYEDDSGLYVCTDCKAEFDVMNFEQEWKYYSDCGGSIKDPSRCHKVKSTGKSIEKVFQELQWDVPHAIVVHVEAKYNKIIGNETIRGKRRKAIIAACLLFAYREFSEHRTSDFVKNIFGLTKKQMSAGLTSYYDAFPEARTMTERPENLLKWILTLTGIDQAHYRKIVHICRFMENSSVLLKRSSPQSVASAVVYFYLCLNPDYKEVLGLTKNKFAEKVLLSDITVTKLVKEASDVSKQMVKL